MTDFSDLEATINASLGTLFKNAVLTYIDVAGDAAVDGTFWDTRDEADAIGTPRGVRLVRFEMLEADLGSLAAGTRVSIRDVAYQVSRIERDKTGWVTLHLRGGVA